ncbi:MAG: hypothetical protein SCM96_09435 [Acidobacteriota bacterium]|nr:hypothetical protein [Acidobacteriota bacterium]
MTPGIFRAGRLLTIFLCFGSGVISCRTGSPHLEPPPSEILSVEGYGQADAQGERTALKGRFAFSFHVSGRGRVEALDAIGRTSFILLFADDRAFFILPSRKAYAVDTPVGMMDRFLGLPLLPGEVLRLMSGRWSGHSEADPSWILRRDEGGRVISGGKGEAAFIVREFFSGTGVPRIFDFSGSDVSGKIRLLDIRFNTGSVERAADTGFLKRFKPATWEDMDAWLRSDR